MAGGARATVPAAAARAADAVRDDRHDLAGPAQVSQGQGGPIVRHPLARRDALRAAQDDAEDAEGQEPHDRRRAQGAGGLLPGVQPGARDHGACGTAPGREPLADQLPRCRPLAAVGVARRGCAVAVGDPRAPRPPRAAGDQGPSKHLPKDDSAEERTAKRPENSGEYAKVNAIRDITVMSLYLPLKRLTFRHNGIDRRFTDVHGELIEPIID